MISILAQRYWKQLAGIALILIIFLFGWYKGYSYEKKQFDAFVFETEVNAKLQEEKNNLLVKQQQKITQNITKEYTDAIKKLNTYYATKRMSDSNSSNSEVSKISSTSTTTNGESESTLSDTIRDCSLDVLQLLYLQQWIRDQEILNEN